MSATGSLIWYKLVHTRLQLPESAINGHEGIYIISQTNTFLPAQVQGGVLRFELDRGVPLEPQNPGGVTFI